MREADRVAKQFLFTDREIEEIVNYLQIQKEGVGDSVQNLEAILKTPESVKKFFKIVCPDGATDYRMLSIYMEQRIFLLEQRIKRRDRFIAACVFLGLIMVIVLQWLSEGSKG